VAVKEEGPSVPLELIANATPPSFGRVRLRLISLNVKCLPVRKSSTARLPFLSPISHSAPVFRWRRGDVISDGFLIRSAISMFHVSALVQWGGRAKAVFRASGLVEEEWRVVRPAEATTGEADAAGLDELRWRSLVSVNQYGRALTIQSMPPRARALGLLSRNRRRSGQRAPRSPRSPRQFPRSP
jgi:hypothetical protein